MQGTTNASPKGGRSLVDGSEGLLHALLPKVMRRERGYCIGRIECIWGRCLAKLVEISHVVTARFADWKGKYEPAFDLT
jgi:hypothetical protein